MESDTKPVDWRAQYLRQRKRAQLFLTTTVVAGLLLTGSVVMQLTADGPTAETAATAPAGAEDRPGGPFGPGGPGGGRRDIVSRFVLDDGSLDTEAIAQFKEQMQQRGTDPAFIEQAVAAAVDEGRITQEQADALLAALSEG